MGFRGGIARDSALFSRAHQAFASRTASDSRYQYSVFGPSPMKKHFDFGFLSPLAERTDQVSREFRGGMLGLPNFQRGAGARQVNNGHAAVPALQVLLVQASIRTRPVGGEVVKGVQPRQIFLVALHEPDFVAAEVLVGHYVVLMGREHQLAVVVRMHLVVGISFSIAVRILALETVASGMIPFRARE